MQKVIRAQGVILPTAPVHITCLNTLFYLRHDLRSMFAEVKKPGEEPDFFLALPAASFVPLMS